MIHLRSLVLYVCIDNELDLLHTFRHHERILYSSIRILFSVCHLGTLHLFNIPNIFQKKKELKSFFAEVSSTYSALLNSYLHARSG